MGLLNSLLESSACVLSAAALVVLLPALFYQNTGWEQYAYRFSIDALPLWMGALSIGISRASMLLKSAIVFSILVQDLGGDLRPLRNVFLIPHALFPVLFPCLTSCC